MASMHKHIVTGRVGSKPELRFMPSGREVASFSLARQARFFDKNANEWKDGEVTWYKVTCFGALAINVVESLDSGYEVTVHAKDLKVSTYKDKKDGSTRVSQELDAEEVLLPLSHQHIQMIDKSAYHSGNKVGGGVGAPPNNSYNNGNNYNNNNTYNNVAGSEEPPF